MPGGFAGVNGDEEPEQERRHHRASDSGEHSHRRSSDEIALTSEGVQVPWTKVMSWVTLLGALATPVGAGFLAKSHLDLGARVEQGHGKTEEKLDRLLDGVARLEKRQESFEERQRQTELDVAALKATRGDKERPR